jgi:cytochrome c oxidase cbb3-type subunit III
MASRSGIPISGSFQPLRRRTCWMATSIFSSRRVTLSLRSPCIKTAVVLLAFGTACSTLSGQGAPVPKQAAGNADAIARGQSQFRKSCSFCHGPDDKDGDLIGAVVREGRPAKGMPAFSLPPSDVSDLVKYIHSRVAELDRRSAGKPPATYALEHLLTGNAEAGRQFFNSKGECSGCHSITGDLRGIASKYPPVELQTRFLYPQDVKQTAEIQPASGERIKGVLAHSDAFTVAIYDEKGWYRSWPRDSVSVTIHDPLSAHRRLLDSYTQTDMHNVFAFLETLR